MAGPKWMEKCRMPVPPTQSRQRCHPGLVEDVYKT